MEINRNMEQARKDLFHQDVINQASDHNFCSPGSIYTGDASLDELCSDNDRLDAKLEEDYFDQLKSVFSSMKKKKSGSPALGCVKRSTPIGGFRKFGKKNPNLLMLKMKGVFGILGGWDKMLRKDLLERWS